MPKNLTIYLPDEAAGEVEKYPDVNWSEVCRSAITDYLARKKFDPNKLRVTSPQIDALDLAETFTPNLVIGFTLYNDTGYTVGLDRLIYNCTMRVGSYQFSPFHSRPFLRMLDLPPGGNVTIQDYPQVDQGFIAEVSNRLTEDYDILVEFQIAAYFQGPAGRFIVTPPSLTARVPYSDWKRFRKKWERPKSPSVRKVAGPDDY